MAAFANKLLIMVLLLSLVAIVVMQKQPKPKGPGRARSGPGGGPKRGPGAGERSSRPKKEKGSKRSGSKKSPDTAELGELLTNLSGTSEDLINLEELGQSARNSTRKGPKSRKRPKEPKPKQERRSKSRKKKGKKSAKVDPILNSAIRDTSGNLKPGIDKRRGRSAQEFARAEQMFSEIRSISAQLLDINIPDGDNYEWDGLTEGDTVFTGQQMEQVLDQLKNEIEEKLGTSVDTAADAVGGLANLETSTIALIKESIAGWEEKTCIKFEETTSPTRNWLEFLKDEGCWSYVGKQKRGKQPISIGEGCETLGIVSHEIGHALGFYHEQGRTDREDFVDIVPENIETGNEANFNKYDDALTLGIPYDEDSVLHYDGWAFSKDRESYPKFTIRAKSNMMQERFGQREGLSFYDIKIANIRYCSRSCGGTDLESADCQYGGYKNPNECTTCNCPEGFGGKFCEILTAGVGTDLGEKKSVTCGETGEIAMEFPKSSGNIVKTFWLLEAPTDKTITITVTEVATDAEDTEQFCTDYLEVKHEDVITAGPRFCEDHPKDFPLPVSLTSQKNLVLLKARLESGESASFKVQYKVSNC